MSSPFLYFIDPVLRGPTLGCMLMCAASALIGVIAYLRRQSLIGEMLSHAAYPGIALGLLLASLLSFFKEESFFFVVLMMGGALTTALLALVTLQFLVEQLKIKSDAALCFILACFFGVGVTLASLIQRRLPAFYRQIQTYLYGQAATMTDRHIVLYGVAFVFVLLVFLAFYKELKLVTFDRSVAQALALPVRLIDAIVYVLIGLAVVIGMRSVGVVLISAMLVAPAVSARQYTNRLAYILSLSVLFGVISGFFGNYLSVELSNLFESRFSLPTGPMIVLVSAAICLFSLLFALERGVVVRVVRYRRFRYRCLGENLLKALWRLGEASLVTEEQMFVTQRLSLISRKCLLLKAVRKGWLTPKGKRAYQLTATGLKEGARMTRLHRLWELYLTDYMGIGADRVHKSAEEIEHIITPEIEKELTLLLKNPKEDPHHQPIPPNPYDQE